MTEERFAVWTENFAIRHTEVTREGFVRIDTIFDYMQEAAANHAANLGCGLQALDACGMMWVLSRLKLSILRTPRLGEIVTVTTWPSGVEKLFATREFVLSCGDETIARGSSCWLLLDQRKMRPLRVMESLPIGLPDNSLRDRNFTGLDKLPRRPCSNPVTVEVHESMIDVNRHMNNARYITQLFDWLSMRLNRAPEVCGIQANFIAATAPGSRLTISGDLADGVWYIEESLDAQPHFQAEVKVW